MIYSKENWRIFFYSLVLFFLIALVSALLECCAICLAPVSIKSQLPLLYIFSMLFLLGISYGIGMGIYAILRRLINTTYRFKLIYFLTFTCLAGFIELRSIAIHTYYLPTRLGVCDKFVETRGMDIKLKGLTEQEYHSIRSTCFYGPDIPLNSKDIDVFYFDDAFLPDYILKITATIDSEADIPMGWINLTEDYWKSRRAYEKDNPGVDYDKMHQWQYDFTPPSSLTPEKGIRIQYDAHES